MSKYLAIKLLAKLLYRVLHFKLSLHLNTKL